MHISLSDPYWKNVYDRYSTWGHACLPVYFRERIAKFCPHFRGVNVATGLSDASSEPHCNRFRRHRDSRIPVHQGPSARILESLHVIGAALLIAELPCDHRREERQIGTASEGASEKPDSHLAHGEDMKFWPSNLDRRLPDSFGGISRTFPVRCQL